jgi:hypothetical protein
MRLLSLGIRLWSAAGRGAARAPSAMQYIRAYFDDVKRKRAKHMTPRERIS